MTALCQNRVKYHIFKGVDRTADPDLPADTEIAYLHCMLPAGHSGHCVVQQGSDRITVPNPYQSA